MTAFGFPNALQFSRLNGAISTLKAQSEQARTELVTGRKSDLPGALKGGVGDAQLLRRAIDKLADFRLSANRGVGRAVSTQIVLTRAADRTAEIGANLLNAIGFEDQAGVRLSGEQARQMLEGVVAGLNQRHEGRALFSGDATDRAPIAGAAPLLDDVGALYAVAPDAAAFNAALDTYFNDPSGGFYTNIYQGGAGPAPRAEIADGELVDASARADEKPIRDLLRSLASIAVAADASPDSKQTEALREAAQSLVEAGAGLTEIRARIGVGEARLQSALERMNAEEPVLLAAYDEKTGVDDFETAARLQQLETQLQTSFVLSARISQLTLANFLR